VRFDQFHGRNFLRADILRHVNERTVYEFTHFAPFHAE
jgi:hypothetical protein